MLSNRNLIDDVLTKIAQKVSPDNTVWNGILEACCALNEKDLSRAILALAETFSLFLIATPNRRLILPVEINYLREIICCLSDEELSNYDEIQLALFSANLLELENKVELAINAYKAIVDTRYYGLAYEFLLKLLDTEANDREYRRYSEKMQYGLASEHDERYRPSNECLDRVFRKQMFAIVREMGAFRSTKQTPSAKEAPALTYNVHAKPYVPRLDLKKIT